MVLPQVRKKACNYKRHNEMIKVLQRSKVRMVLRKARVQDVKAIRRLIDLYAEEEQMLPRSESSIQESLRDFFIIRTRDEVVACCALQIFSDKVAEIRSLAVDPKWLKQGLGRKLVEAGLEEATRMGISKVFTLTYVDGFFRKLGFEVVEKSTLPHKIWNDCIFCKNLFSCREIAMTRVVN